MHGAILIESIVIIILAAAVILIYFLKQKKGVQPVERAVDEEILKNECAAADDCFEQDEENIPTVSVVTSEFKELDEDFEETKAVDEWEEPDPERDEEVVIVDPDTGASIAYSKSFTAKIAQADATVKMWYSDIKNILMSFEGVRSRMSWKRESFFIKQKCVAKLTMRGKTLCLYLAVTPKRYTDTKYKVEDVSETKTHSGTPCLYRIKRPRRAKYAVQMLAEMLCMLSQPVVGREYADYRPPYKTTEKLLEEGNIKLIERKRYNA